MKFLEECRVSLGDRDSRVERARASRAPSQAEPRIFDHFDVNSVVHHLWTLVKCEL